MLSHVLSYLFFFFNDTATTEIYPLSLHDALPISSRWMPLATPTWRVSRIPSISLRRWAPFSLPGPVTLMVSDTRHVGDRKSTRLNSSHSQISYAVFCLKKKNDRHFHPSENRLCHH